MQPYEQVKRVWGHYKVLFEDGKEVKVKQLVCDPGSSLSLQRHFDRKELWLITEGTAYVNTLNAQGELVTMGPYNKFDTLLIDYEEWHQLVNKDTMPLKIVEIQYGRNCVEEDIERKQ